VDGYHTSVGRVFDFANDHQFWSHPRVFGGYLILLLTIGFGSTPALGGYLILLMTISFG
jgi:hypothetical protein